MLSGASFTKWISIILLQPTQNTVSGLGRFSVRTRGVKWESAVKGICPFTSTPSDVRHVY